MPASELGDTKPSPALCQKKQTQPLAVSAACGAALAARQASVARHTPALPCCLCAPPPQVAASAAIPLRGLLDQRRLSGAWRLKEATAGVVEADRLDLGRATVQLAWCVLWGRGAGQPLLFAWRLACPALGGMVRLAA